MGDLPSGTGHERVWPRVSVIIPACNEERFIQRTLDAVGRLTYRGSVDVLVVDNGSRDQTVRLAEQAGARVLIRQGVSVAALRNAGRAEASGEVLAFLDADCTPATDWLEQAIAVMDETPCVTGSRVALPDGGTWVEIAWFSAPPQGRRRVSYINSGNLIVPAAVFDRVGGFDETLISGEDSDFCRRAAEVAPIVSDDRVKAIHHGNPKTVREFFKREVWHGMGGLGTSALSFRNKPLIGALAVVVLSALVVAGLAIWASGSGAGLLLASATALVALMGASAVHRARALAPVRVARLSLLFYVYYIGRAVAVVRLLAGLGHRPRSR